MEEQIKVSIIGEGGSLEKTFATLEKNVDQFQDKLNKIGSGDVFKKVADGAAKTKNTFNQLSTATTKVAASSNTATQSLINLSRVAQDAPYGFIGIANNLNPLLESFQRLKAESGSTGGALKALTGSLIGPAGIGLALGGVSSLVVAYQQGMFKSGESTKHAADRIREAKQALEDYIETLDDVTAANLKGAQSAQEQLVKLQLLYSATQNANIPIAERKKLVDDLQKQYPKYFKNITDETILAGGAQKAYERLASAILQAAKARAGQDKLVEIQKELITLELQKTESLKGQATAYEALRAAQKAGINKGASEFNVAQAASANVLQNAQNINDLQDKYNEKLATTSKLTREIATKSKDAQEISNVILTNVQQNGADVLINPGGELPKSKIAKVKIDKIEAYEVKELDIKTPYENIAKEANKRLEEALKNESHNTPTPFLKLGGTFDTKGFDDFIQRQQFALALQNQLTPAFEQMFSIIENGGSAFEALGSAIGGTIKKLIAQIAALAAVSAILSLLPGAGSFSSIFKTGFAKQFGFNLPGHKDGLWNVPKDEYVARLHKGEMVVPAKIAEMLRPMMKSSSFAMPSMSAMSSAFSFPSNSNKMQAPVIKVATQPTQTLVTELSGTTLRLMLDRTDKYLGRVS